MFLFFRSPPVWDVFWLRAWLKSVLVFQVTSCLRCVLAMSLIKGVCVFQVVWDVFWLWAWLKGVRVFRSPPVWYVFWLRAWLKGVHVFHVTSCLRCVLAMSLIKGCLCFSGHLLFEMCFGLRAWLKDVLCFSGHLLFEMCFGYELD